MKASFEEGGVSIYCADVLDALATLPSDSVQCCVTSPPYWGLRDYGTAQWEGGDSACSHRNSHGVQGKNGQRADRTHTGSQNFYKGECRKCGARRVDHQIGLERTPQEYVTRMVQVFAEVRRVLRGDGTLWLNLGDSYTSGGRKERDPGESKIHPAYEGNAFVDGLRPGTPDGLKPKDLVGIPWRVAFALQSDGWYLRSDIIWHKPNPMPESVTDRPTKSHEYIFLMSKSERYYYSAESIMEPASADTHARYSRGRSDHHKWADGGPGAQTIATNKPGSRFGPGANPKCAEPGSGVKQNWSFSSAVKDVVETRNKRSVWSISTQPYPGAHFATFPEDLVRPCILAGCAEGATVLDPFCGSGTTLLVARACGCRAIGIELSQEYVKLAEKRLAQEVLPLSRESA